MVAVLLQLYNDYLELVPVLRDGLQFFLQLLAALHGRKKQRQSVALDSRNRTVHLSKLPFFGFGLGCKTLNPSLADEFSVFLHYRQGDPDGSVTQHESCNVERETRQPALLFSNPHLLFQFQAVQ